MNDFIKQNGGPLKIAAIVIAIVAAYGEWRIGAHIDSEIGKKQVVTQDQLAVYIERTDALQTSVNDLKETTKAVGGKVDQVIGILLEAE